MAYGSKMEDILRQLARDIITPKFASIKHTANVALEILSDESKVQVIEAWELREICLQPLQLALESRARKLGHTALAGIQTMFKDERFRSSMETSDEDKWLPSQVLTVLAGAHSLAEYLQIEVMKLLLNMTVTASWCTSSKTIIKIAQGNYGELGFGTLTQYFGVNENWPIPRPRQYHSTLKSVSWLYILIIGLLVITIPVLGSIF